MTTIDNQTRPPSALSAALSAAPKEDQIGRGIVAATGAAFGFSVMYVLLRSAGEDYSAVQLLFFRSAFALLTFAPLLWRARATVWRTRRPGGHFVRSLAGLVSMGLMFYCVSRMPLPTLTATIFTMPLFVTILAYPCLGEKVGWRRASAVVAGFIGVFIMIGPQLTELNSVYLLAIAGVAGYSVAVIALRQLGATEPPLTTFFYFTLSCTALSGLVLPWVWVQPDMVGWLCLGGAGIVGGIAQYWMITAYNHAPASIVAPFEYTQLIWASLLALIVWGHVPSSRMWLGAAVVIAAGLYITQRETAGRVSAPRESAPRESAPRESAPRESAPRESA
jgi:drug/metabolite transporter (DMT)-like permease